MFLEQALTKYTARQLRMLFVIQSWDKVIFTVVRVTYIEDYMCDWRLGVLTGSYCT